jgi:hypothetical protein
MSNLTPPRIVPHSPAGIQTMSPILLHQNLLGSTRAGKLHPLVETLLRIGMILVPIRISTVGNLHFSIRILPKDLLEIVILSLSGGIQDKMSTPEAISRERTEIIVNPKKITIRSIQCIRHSIHPLKEGCRPQCRIRCSMPNNSLSKKKENISRPNPMINPHAKCMSARITVEKALSQLSGHSSLRIIANLNKIPKK